ncbi:MAG: diguanylate cyclase [Anaerolineae bacterium]
MTGERILIVDDAAEVRGLLGRLCRREGYETTEAASGEEALSFLEARSYQVAVVDLVMPGMGGEELLRQIRQNYPDTDVIILTGYGELETAATTLSLGAYYYLQKESFNFGLIPLVVGRMVERQRLARANEQLIADLTAANQQLALRRVQQLDSVQHISRALAGGLGVRDIASVLASSLAGLIECDACGVLVGDEEAVSKPLVVITSRRPLDETAAHALAEAMRSAHGAMPDGDVDMLLSATSPAAEPDRRSWSLFQMVPLSSRGTRLGVCMVARHDEQEFGTEDLDILRILGAQGGIALENTYLFARMRDLATRDSLTGLYNHGHFHELLAAELARSERTGRQLGVIMIDVDKDPEHGLKAINDSYGHQAGDALLRDVAGRLGTNLRRADSVARYGGDEFVVLAPEVGEARALVLANRLWRTIRERPFSVAGNEMWLTASVGVAVSHPGQQDTPQRLVALADQACYLAKEQGRDQVCSAWRDE